MLKEDSGASRSKSGLPKSSRLLKTEDFQKTFRCNQAVSSNLFCILVRHANDRQQGRLGVVVSRKVSRKAIRRNRIKRQIREVFRFNQSILARMDVVVIARKACDLSTNEQLRENLLKLFHTVSQKCEKQSYC